MNNFPDKINIIVDKNIILNQSFYIKLNGSLVYEKSWSFLDFPFIHSQNPCRTYEG